MSIFSELRLSFVLNYVWWRRGQIHLTDSLKGQNINAKVEKIKITMPHRGKYEEPIPKLEISDPLQLDFSQVESLENKEVVYTQPTKAKVLKFLLPVGK